MNDIAGATVELALALVAVGLDALAILMLRHLLASLLNQRAHRITSIVTCVGAPEGGGAVACLVRSKQANSQVGNLGF